MRLAIIAAALLATSAAQAGDAYWPAGTSSYPRSEQEEMNDRLEMNRRMDRLEERQRQFENYMRAFEDPPDRR